MDPGAPVTVTHVTAKPIGVDHRRTARAEARRLVAAAADLVLARDCAGCGAQRVTWCAECAATLRAPPFRSWPSPSPLGLPPPFSVAAYDGPVRAALLAHKEDGRLSLAHPLGIALAAAVLAGRRDECDAGSGTDDLRWQDVLLVPAPSRRSAVRARGHDATLRIARVAASELRAQGLAARVLPVLRASRSLVDQAGLGSSARAANLRGALRVPSGAVRLVGGRRVVVVDDVITTGATLAEAARALGAAGADVELVATVAATARRATGRTGATIVTREQGAQQLAITEADGVDAGR